MPPESSVTESTASKHRHSEPRKTDVLARGGEARRVPRRGLRLLDFCWIDPAHESFVRQENLDDIDALFARSDAEPVVAGHRGRETLHLVLHHQSGVQNLTLKRERSTRWKDLLRHVVAGRGYWTKVRDEFQSLRQLAEAGIRCPRPIVCLQRGLIKPRACLLLEELPGTAPLCSYLAGDPFGGNLARRDEFFTALGQEVSRLHATGFNQPDLYSIHIHVRAAGEGWEISFVNFQRSVRHAELPVEKRIRDLASLMATLPMRLANARDREMFFDAYLGQSELEDRAAQVIAGVARRCQRLLTRRKIWEIRENETGEYPSISQLESLETGKMWIDRAFRPHLERAGLANFEAMMTTTVGHRLRALKDRENWRLELHDAHGLLRAYLKKHRVRTGGTWLRAKLARGPDDTPGRVEARNVARLERGGIAAMRLISFGEKLHADGLLESFVLTEELVGYTQLDHFLRQRFGPRQTHRPTPRDRTLNHLIVEVAHVAAKFHKLGYNHRDLYCCHFFIKEPQAGSFQVNLIDLQRVEHRRRRRRRWLVKDLAQLAYSAPRDRISCTHKLAFIKHYLGVNKLRPADKRFIREVLAKQRVMERNLGMHP